jgi:mono/diheme cytochrome c family protein
MLVFSLSNTNAAILGIVGAIFIAFSLISSFLLPRRDPNFPGAQGLRWYIPLCLGFFALMMGTVLVFGVEEEHAGAEGVPHETTPAETTPAETEPAETEPAETTPTETEPAETEPAETTPAETEPAETEPAETEPAVTEPAETEPAETTPGGGGDAAAGASVWTSAGCGACHVLSAAGSTGAVGPNLDESKPTEQVALETVTNGKGAMPPYGGQLTEQQIADVVAFVVESTQG